MERGGCYDRGKDLNWKSMKDIGWMAAMGRPGGGRNDVSKKEVRKNNYNFKSLNK